MATPESGATPAILSADELAKLLPGYLQVQAALADDDFDATRGPIQEMIAATGHDGPLAATLHAMQAASDLAGVRLPHFVNLSNALIAASRQHPVAAGGRLVRMHCPMVDDFTGADWLQRGEPLRNPYFGAEMLECGTIEERIAAVGEHDGHGH